MNKHIVQKIVILIPLLFILCDIQAQTNRRKKQIQQKQSKQCPIPAPKITPAKRTPARTTPLRTPPRTTPPRTAPTTPTRTMPTRTTQSRIPQIIPTRAPRVTPPPVRPAVRPTQPAAMTAQQTLEEEKRLIQEQQRVPWVSKAGLIYGVDKNFGSRVNHILHHTKPDPTKPSHSIFVTKTRKELFDLIDSAWRKVSNPNDPSGQFIVPMGRQVVGTKGQRDIKIIVIPGTSQIITAYPTRYK